MKVYDSLTNLTDIAGPTAVAIGKFDGVHRGHQAVLARLVALARRDRLMSIVLTFDRNPLELFAPDRAPTPLVSPSQRLALLAASGVDATVVVPFNRDFAARSATDFVDQVLVERLHAAVVLVGRDFRYGARAAGNVAQLAAAGTALGFAVQLVDDVDVAVGTSTPSHSVLVEPGFPLEGEGGVVREDPASTRISSTLIRELLTAGDVGAASGLLGRLPRVSATIVHGAARGRELGFPTANLSPIVEGFIPADGVYAGWLTDGGTKYPAAISVGNNPTFEGMPQRQVEAYVLDETLELYGHLVDIDFAQRLRGQIEFTAVPELIEQIAADVAATREFLLG
ncbi:MAG: bifunctional riboflavin kinase/FMN adenylyltransferase [Candidatus Lumbricidophila eiseniae]|uniref:Riboflavin biosynthesis protein n=1 Tax=Candidatus Lumbricidiphila eiseniae TaxID=1969409 RepID=A0A2A6FPN2_9MICO|nr:MAG: bifunctional riboflavin kinase/FMN adenylyltransferase [Candidatus Lumbricidophila eiseniae]